MSKIEWTHRPGTKSEVWNPSTGCDKVSQGCKFCYAETMTKRLKAMGQPKYSNGFKFTIHADQLDKPKTWKTPRTVFVNSMSDLFHEEMPVEFLKQVFGKMNETPQHTYQILTKRSDLLNMYDHDGVTSWYWTRNIWMGVSVEDTKVLHRIDHLRPSYAKTKFLSCEPLLEDIANHPDFDLRGIDWVIVGGESGHNPRECKLEWIENIVEKCIDQHIPVFVKQMGKVLAKKMGMESLHGKDVREFPKHLQIQQFPY